MVEACCIVYRVTISRSSRPHANHQNDDYCHQHTQYLVDGYNLIVENHTSCTLNDTPQYHEENDIMEIKIKMWSIEKFSHNYFGLRPFEN